MVSVTFQFIAGPRHVTELEAKCTVETIVRTVEQAFGASTSAGVRVILRGEALPVDRPQHVVVLREGDHLLVAPQRKAPSAELVASATRAARAGGNGRRGDDDEDDEEEEEERIALPPDAARWEAAVVEALRVRAGCADWLLEWVVLLRPVRLLTFAAFLAGCVLSSRLGLGPVFILLSIIAGIFTNLGTRRAGEASAYSIFNRGVQRLPGQLDAGEVDRQMRQGQL